SDGTHASYRYDARGLLTQAQATTPGGRGETASQVTFEYDAAGRRTNETQAHHGQVWRLAHELDALGHRTTTHLPDVGALAWQRYGSGHVHGVLLNGEPLAAFERDALHRETQRTQGLVNHQFSYSGSGMLAAHEWQGMDSRGNPSERARAWRSCEQDSAGQITAIHDALRDSRHYQYDAASRLVDVNAGRSSEHFSYDPSGNLLAVSNGKATHIGRAQGDRLLSLVTPELPVVQSPQYAYDGHGNRVARTVAATRTDTPEAADAPTTRYRYDGTHQLTHIEHADGAASRYEYDALGRRTAKRHTDAEGRTWTTLFVWDGDWMAQEVRPNGGSVTPLTYVPHPNHAGPLTKLEGATAYHYVTDHLGTPQELYDDRRQIVWAADLSAYGKTRRYLKHEIDNPIRFPGQYFDAESGLHYNRFRYYDP
ncbi:RHS domain-containing protein, partial [Paraburkholderia sp. Ac-20347]|uniref:RHS domain-containing protein n=1 Tax=Paraburkholderia sp. Ac-20347 TaxID=2703892 RepID=UPI00197E061C